MPEMKKILVHAGCAAVACAFLFHPSVLPAQDAATSKPILSPAEARETIGSRAGDPGFVLLDVRTPEEFREERIKGALLVDYLSPSFRDRIAKLDRDKSYLVYCRTGHRSDEALRVMRELGFTNVSVLDGGIMKWKEAGLPTAR